MDGRKDEEQEEVNVPCKETLPNSRSIWNMLVGEEGKAN